jgi:apolipoprotein N-acyltransferase
VACFHAAYTSLKFPAAGLLIFGYAFGMVKLCDQPTVRRAFYFGLAAGYLCCAPQLFFMWRIFSVFSVVLWFVLAFWSGLFTAMVCGCQHRWGKPRTVWLIPLLWTGIEYFRSELYYLKFSWLNPGYALDALPQNPFLPFPVCGMYGVGLVIFLLASIWAHKSRLKARSVMAVGLFLLGFMPMITAIERGQWSKRAGNGTQPEPLSLVGIQLEFPTPAVLPKILTQTLARNTNAQVFVLSEYTLNESPGGVPDELKNWCREHSKFLVVGGKEFVTNERYYNTAFVVGTNGEIVFAQAKSVPIQFFRDGLPAPKQELWDSPWGKIGICICYDLSYTRVTDELVRQGAQLLIVPTMDVETWGLHQHELHSRVAPVRAAEYGVPIFRLASSGISQAVNANGRVAALTTMPGNGQILAAQFRLPMHGTLPFDRGLAPLCTAFAVILLATLLRCWWREKHTLAPKNQPSVSPTR